MFDNDLELNDKAVFECPYCNGKDIVKRGLREKKHETIQVYFCKHCNKKFTPLMSKNKSYPLRVILEAVSYYNRLLSLEEVSKRIYEKYNMTFNNQTILNWLEYYKEYLPFLRMRGFIEKKYERKEILAETQMFHEQIYSFKYHRAKLEVILDESFKHL